MKRAYPIPVVIIVLAMLFFTDLPLSSCTKTQTVTVRDTVSVKVQDTITVAPKPTIASLLTGIYWETDSAFSNYTGPGTGALVYVRGGSGNSMNLDNYFYTWTTNGFVWAVENGTYFQFDWNFVNGDSNLIKAYNPSLTDYSRILSISSSKLVLYDSTGRYYDALIPVP